MSDTLTLKQETFALRYVELGNASEAYRQSYDAENMKPESVWSEASRTMANPLVASRIMELQEEHRARHTVTVDSLTEELEEARQLAMTRAEGASAAVSATMGKAKLHGLAKDTSVTVNLNSMPLPEQDKSLLAEYAKAD